MTYTEFVRRPSDLMKRIEHKIDDVNYKWTVCLNSTPQIAERVQSSPSNITEKTYLNYIQAKKQLDYLQEELDKAREEIREFLYKNLDLDYADALDWRYCNGKSVQDIAELAGLSYSGASSRIGRADIMARKAYAAKLR